MKKIWLAVLALVALGGVGYAITVNPASNALADSAATALTIAYRDANGAFDAILSNLVMTGPARLQAKTKAQFDALDPTVVGEMYLCSDCSEKLPCISTGTAVGDFQRFDSPTAGCGTGE